VTAARDAPQRALASDGHPHNGGLGTERPASAGDGSVCNVAGRRRSGKGRTQLVEMLVSFEVDEFGEG
jgi:hypothetical protein